MVWVYRSCLDLSDDIIKAVNMIKIMEVSDLANIKSAKKRVLVIETKTLRNKMIKSKIKTLVKNVESAIESGNKADAEAKLKVAISEISKAASKGIFHKNTASRKISRLTLAVNRMA